MVITRQLNGWDPPFPAAAGLQRDRFNEAFRANATLFCRER
jgi:hypothetical protein